MPLLPIKDRDGDKEASTAGRKQTDKTNMATQSVWKPPGFTVHSTSGPSPVGRDLYKPAKFDNHYVLFTADKEIQEILDWIHHRHWGLCYKAEWGVMGMVRYCTYYSLACLMSLHSSINLYLDIDMTSKKGQWVLLHTVHWAFSFKYERKTLRGFGSAQFYFHANWNSLHVNHGQPRARLNYNNCPKTKHS